jgi:hypothetical protein
MIFSSASNQYLYYLDNTNLRIATVTSNTFAFPSYSIDVWQYITLTRTGGDQMKAYRDGVESTTGSITNSNGFSINLLGHRAVDGANRHFIGRMDEFAIKGGYGATPSEVTTLAAGADFESVVGALNTNSSDIYLKFNESGTTMTAADESPNAATSTLTNYVSGMWVDHNAP